MTKKIHLAMTFLLVGNNLSQDFTIIKFFRGGYSCQIAFHVINMNFLFCETKVWLILILMITKQGLELMTTF